jgi:aspartate aminotransferase
MGHGRQGGLGPLPLGSRKERSHGEGTFYLWAKWAGNDPERQWNALADRDVFVMPGSVMNAPDHFRICLTASDAMVAKALRAFTQAQAA